MKLKANNENEENKVVLDKNSLQAVIYDLEKLYMYRNTSTRLSSHIISYFFLTTFLSLTYIFTFSIIPETSLGIRLFLKFIIAIISILLLISAIKVYLQSEKYNKMLVKDIFKLKTILEKQEPKNGPLAKEVENSNS